MFFCVEKLVEASAEITRLSNVKMATESAGDVYGRRRGNRGS